MTTERVAVEELHDLLHKKWPSAADLIRKCAALCQAIADSYETEATSTRSIWGHEAAKRCADELLSVLREEGRDARPPR